MTVPVKAVMPDWMRALAAAKPFGPTDGRGTLNYIDDAARARAVEAIKSGVTISLSRRLQADYYGTLPDDPTFRHSIDYVTTPNGMGWGHDHLSLDPHGMQNTHIDALNHVAVDDTYYNGRPVDSPEQGSVDVLGASGVLARAIYVDIPTLRGEPWSSSPVTGADLDAAYASAGLECLPGDAICLDMGRDVYERHVGHMLGGPGEEGDANGGLGSAGARWIAEHGVSMLAWDMLDAAEAKQTLASAHVLTWAIGLLLVDNCDFEALRTALGPGTQIAGALVLAPLPIEGANGANLNPLILR